MAATLVIEEESGTTTGRVHAHDGYYAGDFSTPRYDTRIITPFNDVRA